MVIVGVAGEIICEWGHEQGKRALLLRGFGVLLIAGLLVEMWEAVRADEYIERLQATDVERQVTIQELKVKVATLETKASEAKERADQADIAKAEAEQKFKSIAARQAPRWLQFDSKTLKDELSKKPRAEVEVLCVDNDQEAYFTAYILTTYLKLADWHATGPKEISIQQARALGNLESDLLVRARDADIRKLVTFSTPDGETEFHTESPVGALYAALIHSNKISMMITPQADSSLKPEQIQIIVGQKVW